MACVQFAVAPAFAAAAGTDTTKTAETKKKKKKSHGKKTDKNGTVTTTSGQVDAPPADAAPVPPPAPAPAPVVVAAPVAPVAAPNTVTVHINAPKPVSLERRASGTSAWEHVCNSPCDVSTSTLDEYQIVGEELNESKPFILDGSQGDKVTLDVAPGYHNKAARGGWVLAGGIVLVVGGVITLAAGSKSGTLPGGEGTQTNNQNTDFIFAGSALVLAGVIVGITGGAFMYDNAHTKVDGAIGAVPDKRTDVKAQVQVTASLDHSERLPTWHQDLGPQLAPTRSVSLFSGTF